MKPKFIVAAVAGSVLSDPAYLRADTASLTLTPTADSRIFDANWGWDLNDGNGGDIGIYQSRDRSLVRFVLPVGATIQSANLALTVTGTYGGNPNGEAMNIYRLTGGWTETGVTWNNQPGYDGTVHASSTANPGIGQTLTWDVTSLASDWAGGATANHGLIIINSGATNGLHFAAKENGTVSYRPYLTTSFTTPTSAPAGSWFWSGGSSAWTDTNKWLDAGNPATWAGEKDAVFGTGSDTAGTVTIAGTVMPRTLWFQNAGFGNYTISGGTVDLGGAMRIVDTASDATIVSSLSNGALFKQGTGKLGLTSTGMGGTPVNTYTGGTVINAGTIEIHGRSADNGGYTSLGTGAVTINNGGTLVSASDWTTGNEWNGGNVGTITVNAGGTWTINGAGNTVRNGLVLNGATVNGTGASGDWGGMYLRNTSVTAGGNATSSIAVDTALNATTTMTVDAGSQLNYSGAIHNQVGSTGGITKSGNGTLALSGNNSFSGQTDITAGTVVAASGTALGTGGHSGATMSWIRDGATLALQGGVSLDEHFHVWGSGVSGQGAVRSLSGANALTDSYALRSNTTIGVDADSLTMGALYEDSGSFGITKVGVGTLSLAGSNSYTGATTVGAGTLDFHGGTSSIGVVNANGGSTVFSGGNTTINGNLTLNADNSGSGLLFSGGVVTMNQLSSWVTDGLQFTIAAGAEVYANGGVYCRSWRGASGMYLNGGTLHTPWIAGNSSSTWWLNEGAYIHFNGTKIAATQDQANFIQLAGGENYGNENFAKLDATTTFDTAGHNVGIGVELRGTGGLTKDGGGVLTLNGNSTYTGATTVDAGKLVVNGSISTSATTVQSGATLGGSGTVGSVTIDSGAFLAPGNSPGTLNVDGDYTQNGTLVIEVNGLTAGTLYDQVNVDRIFGDGAVSISGNFSVLFGGGYTPVNGDLIFILLNDGNDSVTGTFSGLVQNAIVGSYGGFDWRISYTADSGWNTFDGGGNDIALMAVPEPRVALVGGLALLTLLRRRRQ